MLLQQQHSAEKARPLFFQFAAPLLGSKMKAGYQEQGIYYKAASLCRIFFFFFIDLFITAPTWMYSDMQFIVILDLLWKQVTNPYSRC